MKYAYIDAKSSQVLGWLDTEAYNYAELPASEQLIRLTDQEFAQLQGQNCIVVGGTVRVNDQPSPAHVWDTKKSAWVLDKTKQAELDKQVLDSADAQLTCLMSQMCAWLTIESYKPKTDQRGGNILSPVKIDEMLKGLPDSVENDLMRNAWSRATNVEFTSATTQSFAEILGMSKDQLRVAMNEAKAL